ncbi:hypothetical protein [Sporosarcina sp. YIM B06819]|uniref:hypothetical protein n=1 Tax=Sporosarcina sp. YIM B06819 TaxID=3081769 RepID=UPI00298CBF7A|nr:hypothetical protein [Sporosarcina sp. YIM B06819]
MLDYKNLSDKELALHILQYIDRTQELMNDVSECLESKSNGTKQEIQERYKALKNEMKKDAHYLGLSRNRVRGNYLYSRFFQPSISEAAAFGFQSPVNSKIDFNYFSSVEEAHYKLTKYHSREKWNVLINKWLA